MQFFQNLQPPTTPKVVRVDLPGLSARALALAEIAAMQSYPLIVICSDSHQAEMLFQTLSSTFKGEVLSFPHWENLPWDHFSPNPSIISDRMLALLAVGKREPCIIVTTIFTLALRLEPRDYFLGRCFKLAVNQQINFADLRQHLMDAGYLKVNQVHQPGEFCLRGSLIDFYPMAAKQPIRIDFFDDQIEGIRTFNPENQQSIAKVDSIELIPTSEIPFDDRSLSLFATNWNQEFPGASRSCSTYQDVKNSLRPGGIEYYLPLFYPSTASFFDYLDTGCTVTFDSDCHTASQRHWKEITTRYENLCGDLEKPILPAEKTFWRTEEIFAQLKNYPRIELGNCQPAKASVKHFADVPNLKLDLSATKPLTRLAAFLEQNTIPLVLGCNSAGRQAVISDLLDDNQIPYTTCNDWHEWQHKITEGIKLYTLPLPLPDDFHLAGSCLVLSENAIYGEQIAPQISRKQSSNHSNLIRNLVELTPDCLVVHSVYGLGRYKRLETIEVNPNTSMEFMSLEYAKETKLLVPVTELHYISRYQGAKDDEVQLDRLGNDSWDKKVKKAEQRARDTAVELLEIYARRATLDNHACAKPSKDYYRFCAEFNFVETPDQQQAIAAVIADMCSDKSMDRLICGDVGFGKTEVAMRAAFLATENGSQVAILCPTTLLAQQHYNNFVERFGSWSMRIGVISRFESAKQTAELCESLAKGQIDILIGTHALITHRQHFAKLGLVIIDEEHRFGVMQKDQLKSLRTSTDILTLTATPIPRTLNFSLSGIRDISIIATAPSNRLAIQTMVLEERQHIVREAVMRELMRGGQIFVVYNQVKSIKNYADRLAKLIPEARIDIAHGQMGERELERVMTRFYHQQFNLLVCSTIIENGIDIPTANTIIVMRADKFGLAQLHQLRGRVGRSHHQAYAYMFIPEYITDNARARLSALSAAKTLGSGFSLAMHDLEIRGAGELLGHEQSGDIAKVGFTLYLSMLEDAIKSLKDGKLETPEKPCEIDLQSSAIIPADYITDTQIRLQLYKRVANTTNTDELAELKVEMNDRFGKLPEEFENLLQLTRLRHRVSKLGVTKIKATSKQLSLIFCDKPKIELKMLMQLIQSNPQSYRMSGANTLTIRKQTQSSGERIALITNICAQIQQKKKVKLLSHE